MYERYLVLGSNSFTGAHLIDTLLGQPNIFVTGVSRSNEPNPIFLPYRYRKSPRGRFEFHRIDINRQMDRLVSLCDRFEPQIIVNYAAQGEVRNSWKWPDQWYRTNCLAVVQFTNWLKDRPYLRRYVAVSTPEVYGHTGLNIAENQCYQPSTPYAASKLAGDLHLMTLFKRYGFPVVFTRAANLYGIHQQLYRIIPKAIIYLKMGRRLSLHGQGKTQRAFVHARDIAEATILAACKGQNGEVYHLAPDNGLQRIADVVQSICRWTGHDFYAAVDLIEENYGQDERFSLSAKKAVRELGWHPRIDFEEGVMEVIRWVEDNWGFISQQSLEYIHKA